jgi:ankyrin repeat protein
MKTLIVYAIALMLLGCSRSQRFSDEDIRLIMKADDTNAIASAIRQRGANGYITLPFTSKKTPFIVLAAESRATNTIRFLLEQGANLNATNYRGKTALIQICTYGINADTNMIAYLLSKGANVSHKQQYDGWDALHYAALDDKTDVVRLLLVNGADPNTKDASGRLLRDQLKNVEILDIMNDGHGARPGN